MKFGFLRFGATAFFASVLILMVGPLFHMVTLGSVVAYYLNKFFLLHLLIAFAVLEIKKNTQKSNQVVSFLHLALGAIGFSIPLLFDTLPLSVEITSPYIQPSIFFGHFFRNLLLFALAFRNDTQGYTFVIKLATVSAVFYAIEFAAAAYNYEQIYYLTSALIAMICATILLSRRSKEK